MTKSEFLLRVGTIVLAALTPFICLAFEGLLNSYSAYWTTPMQPFFILTNATTSYYLFGSDRWRPSAVLLLLLTAFSVDSYGTIHNIIAIAFFIINLWPLYTSHHHRWILIPYVGSVIALPFNMMIMETIAISSLVVYHGLMLYSLYKYKKPVTHEQE